MNNENNEQNNNLGSMNLGSVNLNENPGTIPVTNADTINPTNLGSNISNNVESIESLDQTTTIPTNNVVNNTPINLNPMGMDTGVLNQVDNISSPSEPEPLTSTTLTENSSVNLGASNVSNNNPGYTNPINLGVPTPPPLPTTEMAPQTKPKKKVNIVLILVLVLVLVAAIGGGVYYVLVKSKQKAIVINPLKSQIELGTIIDTTNYKSLVSVSNYSGTCSVGGDKVDTTKVGTYSYTITCDKVTKTYQIKVLDSKEPVVVTKDLIVLPNTKVVAKDFVSSVEDASKVTYETKEEINTSEEGEFNITIVATDAYQNATTVEAKLTVTANAPTTYLYCEDTKNASDTLKTTYRFGLSNDYNVVLSEAKNKFIYKNEDDYTKAVLEYETNKELNGISGSVTYDEENYTITITSKVDENKFITSNSLTEMPKTDTEIQTIFNDTCMMQFE